MLFRQSLHIRNLTITKPVYLILLLTILSILNAKTSYSQTLKTFNGVFLVNMDENGKANYSYYDDNKTQERLKEGAFQYNYNDKDELLGTFSRNITGNFRKGMKHGLWTYTLTYKDYVRATFNYDTDASSKYSATGTIILRANYKNGLPDGIWTYSSQLKQREKYRFMHNVSYSAFRPATNVSFTINFSEGKYVGQLVARNGKYLINGQFDSQGYMNSKWHVTGEDYEDQLEYDGGAITRLIKHELPSGKLLENYTQPDEVKALRMKYGDSINTAIATANGYIMNTGNCFGDEFAFVRIMLTNNNDFLHSATGGDKSLSIDNYNMVTDIKKGGYYHFFKPVDYINLKENAIYQKAEGFFKNADYFQALGYYKNLTNAVLKPADTTILFNKRNYCDSMLELNMKKAALGYVGLGYKYYEALIPALGQKYSTDSAACYYKAWGTTADGSRQIVMKCNELGKLRKTEEKLLLIKYAEIQLENFRKALPKIDLTRSIEYNKEKIGNLDEDSEKATNDFAGWIASFHSNDRSLLEHFLEPNSSTDTLSNLQFKSQELGKAYFNCRTQLINQAVKATSISELYGYAKQLNRMAKRVAEIWDGLNLKEAPSTENLKLCEQPN